MLRLYMNERRRVLLTKPSETDMSEPAPVAVQTLRTPPPAVLERLSGLEFIRAIMSGAIEAPSMAKLLRFGIVEAEEGRIVFAGTPGAEHLNPMGIVHGGYAATMLDSCMTCAVQSTLKPGQACTTLDLIVHYTKAATAQSGELRAEGKVVHAGRQFGTAEGRLTDANGRIIAHATTSCLIFPVRPATAS